MVERQQTISSPIKVMRVYVSIRWDTAPDGRTPHYRRATTFLHPRGAISTGDWLST
jgi:hypothetical protein